MGLIDRHSLVVDDGVELAEFAEECVEGQEEKGKCEKHVCSGEARGGFENEGDVRFREGQKQYDWQETLVEGFEEDVSEAFQHGVLEALHEGFNNKITIIKESYN
jgi:hypothetical protein